VGGGGVFIPHFRFITKVIKGAHTGSHMPHEMKLHLKKLPNIGRRIKGRGNI